jgi:hypothetical protein
MPVAIITGGSRGRAARLTRGRDHASAQILAFVARRLGSESVGLVFAARVPSGDLAGLPELVVAGLPEADARARCWIRR